MRVLGIQVTTKNIRGDYHLFNQLAVVCYAPQSLNYIKAHQAEMRVDLYQVLYDAFVAGDIDATGNIAIVIHKRARCHGNM